jgi:hypothetical protein
MALTLKRRLAIKCATVDMARTAGFENAAEANVEELFQSYTEELSNEMFWRWRKNYMMMINPLMSSNKHLSTKQLTGCF